MIDPNEAPQFLPDSSLLTGELKQRRKFWLRAIWIAVAGVIVPPMLGLLGTFLGMVSAFGEVSKTGESDPGTLAGGVSVALLMTAWGLAVSAIALMVLIGVLIRFFTLPKLKSAPLSNPSAT